MFQGGEADIRAVNAHNVQENISTYQDGGTNPPGLRAHCFSDSDGDVKSVDSAKTKTTEQHRELGLGIEGILDEVLEVHGVAPVQKGEGVTWLMTENPNGVSTTISSNG